MSKKSAALLFACSALLAPAAEWVDDGHGRIAYREDGTTVLVYNSGAQLAGGAPEHRRRCCYIYPLLTPAGVSPLDDFPKDHWHHRGLFWAWPVVETGGKRYDLWLMNGIKHRTERTAAHSGSARLVAENGWYAGGQKIVAETVTVRVFPVRDNARELEVTLRLEAAGAAVTLRGSEEQGKSYGGFSARFAPREKTVIRADGRVIEKDEDLAPHHSAELEAVYDGRRASLRIEADRSNPGAPYQWCLRNYGFIGASFPGRTETADSFVLQPGVPVTLKFRVRVADLP